jgi:hypothetical protein
MVLKKIYEEHATGRTSILGRIVVVNFKIFDDFCEEHGGEITSVLGRIMRGRLPTSFNQT